MQSRRKRSVQSTGGGAIDVIGTWGVGAISGVEGDRGKAMAPGSSEVSLGSISTARTEGACIVSVAVVEVLLTR